MSSINILIIQVQKRQKTEIATNCWLFKKIKNHIVKEDLIEYSPPASVSP